VKPDKFNLEYDIKILDHPDRVIVGSLTITEPNDDLLDPVPNKFQKWTQIKSKEASKSVPRHKPYDHALDLTPGQTPPWGSYYAIPDQELEVLWQSVKSMLDTVMIQKSKSQYISTHRCHPKTTWTRSMLMCRYQRY
jgi:hypothetical protein